jgi:cobalt transporter subunit CbtA
VLRNTLLTAIVAGLVAALAMSVLQSLWLTPLILQAESYEEAAAVAPAEHHHDATAWKPEDGWSRRLFTFAATAAMAIGYALLLTAVYLGWRQPRNAAFGLLYGLAGFAIFFAAPGLGLAPELPGTASADIVSRQLWWIGTALATAAGIALIVVQPRWWLRVVGLAVLVAPHLVAAPRPAVEGSAAPAALQSQFVIATSVCSAIFWLILGWSSALAYQKLLPDETPVAT